VTKRWILSAVLSGIFAGAASAQAPGYPGLPADTGSAPPALVAPGCGQGADLSLPSYDPNAFFGHALDPQPCRPTFWANGEALFGFTGRAPLAAPLVTTTSTPSPTSVGALGQPGTAVLFGNNGIDIPALTGARVTLGIDVQDRVFWMLPIEVSGFYMGASNKNFSGVGDFNGTEPLARPIYAAQGNVQSETVYLSSFPGFVTGQVQVSSGTRLWGLEMNFLGHTGIISYYNNVVSSLTIFAGFNYTSLTEDLQVWSTATPLDPAFQLSFAGNTTFGQGSTTYVNDVFSAKNHFYAPQVGSRFEMQYGPVFANAEFKLAAGGMDQVVTINGSSTLIDNTGLGHVAPGGILAVGSNIGRFQRTEFAWEPQAAFKVGLEPNPHFRIDFGYNIMYLSDVARPGDFVSRSVNTQQVPTDFAFNPSNSQSPPSPVFHTTDFWMQGLSLGMTISF
jgi:hypothetical protein